MQLYIPNPDDVRQAHEIISPQIHKTPVLTNQTLNNRTGCSVFLKCENFQRAGAFKFRGASFAVSTLSDQEAAKGVATHSSGNHAQALALAARLRGIPSYIAMPKNAPQIKITAVKGYGAKITFCESTLQAREETLKNIVEHTGATFIPPYNDPRIIAGQGTAALELLEQQPKLNLILAPVGGGGLLSGTAIIASEIAGCNVIGVEPEAADDAYRSFKARRLIPLQHTNTIADGLRTSLGDLTFACIKQYVHDIITVSEQAIIDAMRFVWERMKIIIEPSSAVPVAAVLTGKIEAKGQKVGIIISGGNADLDHLPWHRESNN